MKSSTRLVLYGVSTFMDMVAGTLLFVAPVRAAHMGASYSMSAGMGVAWALGAGLMTVILSRVVNQHNAASLCLASCIVQAVLQLAVILFARTPEAMLALMFGIGLTHTLFYVPYYVFFKTVDSSDGMSLARSVGVYTFAWSLGMAIGPLWSGFLLTESAAGLEGWQLCFCFTIVSLLLIAAGVLHVRRHSAHALHAEPAEIPFMPDFARLSWLAALCGSFAFSLVRGLFPAGAVAIGLPEEVQGGVIFSMGLFQALSAFFLARLLYWMYRPAMLGWSGLLGFVGMVLFLAAFAALDGWSRVGAFFLGAVLFGVYSGSFYFYTAYHCLAHPSRAGFNVAVCEGMYAAANIVGLLVGGLLSDAYGVMLPYLLAALFIGFFTCLQIWLHMKNLPAALTAKG